MDYLVPMIIDDPRGFNGVSGMELSEILLRCGMSQSFEKYELNN